MLKDRKVYESKLDAQLARWKVHIDALKNKAGRAGVHTKIKYDQSIDALEGKQEEATLHLRKLKIASDDAWEDVKNGTDKVWSELKNMLQDLSR